MDTPLRAASRIVLSQRLSFPTSNRLLLMDTP
jgi:hypothetical protein